MSDIKNNELALRVLLIAFLSFGASGCASTIYQWNGYDSTLYKHYKHPDQTEIFLQEIKQIVDLAENEKRVPPGMYAEYGYLLYQAQQYGEALIYFKQEQERWPESHVIMKKMIANTEKLAKQ